MTEEKAVLASLKKTGIFEAKAFNSAIWLVASQSYMFSMNTKMI